ncbi:MAG: hypothetical protein JXB29_12295 [Sedimentisphaerales bacterium]|nr:hypothetical protein [Sedimentisphaerales bacterium]
MQAKNGRDSKGRFAIGNPGNPKGRPKKPEIDALRVALKKAAEKYDKTLLDHAIERAYTDNNVLIAILRKLLPDLRSVEQNINTEVEQCPITEAEEVKLLQARLARLQALQDVPSPIIRRAKRTSV